MQKFLFIKLLAVMTCLVSGGLLAGLATAGMDIKNFKAEEIYAQEIKKDGITTDQGLSGKKQERIIISLVGDVLLASGVGEAIAARGTDYPWKETSDILRESDLAVANLECAVSERGRPAPDKEFTFRALPRSLEGTVNAGIDVFTLANNHVLDFGREAMLDTIDYITKSGMRCAGAGLTENEALRPAVLERNGKKVAVLSFTRIIPRSDWIAGSDSPGVASGHDYQLMMDTVRAAGREADITVVCMHWGNETEDFPDSDEVQLARDLVDAGADIVAGHHPHVLQGIEIYKGKIIAYSLGNFIFTTSFQQKGREGAILQVTAGPNGEYRANIIPTFISSGSTALMKGADRKRVLDRVNQLSVDFNTSVDGSGDVKAIP